ncbi:MAG: RluA family pseudouridine synthase [Oscillospiraceae bacterium]|nr:RluA family pseudouridine synthase [Oscillospiraceae bacterium]
MRVLTHIVTAEEDGAKLLRLLRGTLRLSYSLVQSLKWRSGAIQVNGENATVARIVRFGDEITVNITDNGEISPHIVPVAVPLDILYEDEDFLILNKSAGMAVHSAAATEETVTVAGAVAHYLGGAPFHPVNRLDKGVSGIMTVAKSGHVHDLCMRILHTDSFRREYRGICHGCPQPPQGEISLPIGRDEASLFRRRIDPHGQEAKTCYKVLEKGDLSLLLLRPVTGRTHQLRLHCAALGCPLAGDWLYGTEEPGLIARPALHSYELWLHHPLTGAKIHLIAPLPEDMRRLISPDSP